MSSNYDSSLENFDSSKVKQKIKAGASATGSAIKKGGEVVVKTAKKVGGWFAGWIRWLFYGGIALLVLFVLFQVWRFFG
jgi:hypothetical protein